MTGRSVCRSWSPITGVLPLHGHLSGSSAGRRSWSPITGVLPLHGHLSGSSVGRFCLSLPLLSPLSRLSRFPRSWESPGAIKASSVLAPLT